MQLRPATESDADALAAVYHSAYRENRELGFPAKAETVAASTVREWIREHEVFVAVDDGDVIGGVRLETTDPGRAKLSRLGVHDDRKGEGVGRTLVEHVEAVAADAGHDVLWLTTPEGHPYLPDFYRDRGYERTGDYPLEYRDYDEMILEKRLD